APGETAVLDVAPLFYDITIQVADTDEEVTTVEADLTGNDGELFSVLASGFLMPTGPQPAFAVVGIDQEGNSVVLEEAGDGDPIIVFDPPISEGVVATLNAGETGEETVTISNTGSAPLEFEFSQYLDGGAIAHEEEEKPHRPTARQLGLRKGDPDPRPSYTPRRDQGGPDAFGYRWIDSNEEGGPAFEDIDIEATGTPVTFKQAADCSFGPVDEGYAAVDLPFTFNFYGQPYTQLRVNANGFVTFDFEYEGCSFTQDPIPTVDPPNNAIFPLWDDFEGNGADNAVYTEELADGRFVIQWTNWERFLQDLPNTFQIILSPSGAIKFQYLELEASSFSYEIGVENEDGTVGLQVASGDQYAEVGLAVLIQARPDFVTDIEPATGTVEPGGSVDVTFSLQAPPVGGTYEGEVTVVTNVPGQETLEYPVTVIAVGTPGLAYDPMSLDFGDVFIDGGAQTIAVTATNTGSDVAEITAITSDNDVFVVTADLPITIGPGNSDTFSVTFTPTAVEDYTGELTIVSNVDDSPQTLPLSGSGIPAPVGEVSPEELTFTVAPGTMSDPQTVTLDNTGGSPLTYEIISVNTSRAATALHGAGDATPTVNAPERARLLAAMQRTAPVDVAVNVVNPRGAEPGDFLFSAPTQTAPGGIGQVDSGDYTIYVCDLATGGDGGITEMFSPDLVSMGTFASPGAAGRNITGCAYYPDGNGGAGALWFLEVNTGSANEAQFIEVALDGTPTGAVVDITAPDVLAIGLSYSQAFDAFFYIDIVDDDIYAVNPDGTLVDGYPVNQTCLDDGAGVFGNGLDALGDQLDVIVGTSAAGRPDRVQVTDAETGDCITDDEGEDLSTPIEVTTDGFLNGVLRARQDPN
ncbi:MAG: choice-of-anchor D domain-containing protein, partial [Rhodothermales bacterium]|nr:choice-of-anchor D domain-containing protein [Rhodothermales bacterium]